jgi:hypothetical protein
MSCSTHLAMQGCAMLAHTRWSFHAHITDRILSEVLCWPSTTLTLFYGHGGMDLAQYCDYCCIHELLAGGLPPPLQAATLRAHPSSVSCWWCWQDVLRAHARDELGIDLDNYSNPLQVTSNQLHAVRQGRLSLACVTYRCTATQLVLHCMIMVKVMAAQEQRVEQ